MTKQIRHRYDRTKNNVIKTTYMTIDYSFHRQNTYENNNKPPQMKRYALNSNKVGEFYRLSDNHNMIYIHYQTPLNCKNTILQRGRFLHHTARSTTLNKVQRSISKE